jgi:hypothetical protein
MKAGMRYLLYLDAALTALGTAMTLGISFVCLVYSLNLDASPGMRAAFPALLTVSACFLGLAVAAGSATFALVRRRRWLWWAQAVLAIALPAMGLLVWSRLAGA